MFGSGSSQQMAGSDRICNTKNHFLTFFNTGTHRWARAFSCRALASCAFQNFPFLYLLAVNDFIHPPTLSL